MLSRGLIESLIKGVPAVKEELSQMHIHSVFREIMVKELTRKEKVRAQEGLMILNQKRCGRVKG